MLFVSQAYYPGWVANDEAGQSYRVIRAFGGLTGIVIPGPMAGVITLRFSPAILRIGALLSVGSCMIVLLWITAGVWKRQSRLHPPGTPERRLRDQG